MERIGWKMGFVIWGIITVFVQLMTTVEGFIYINNPDFVTAFGAVICLILGLFLLPLFVWVLVYLGHKAFK